MPIRKVRGVRNLLCGTFQLFCWRVWLQWSSQDGREGRAGLSTHDIMTWFTCRRNKCILNWGKTVARPKSVMFYGYRAWKDRVIVAETRGTPLKHLQRWASMSLVKGFAGQPPCLVVSVDHVERWCKCGKLMHIVDCSVWREKKAHFQ